MNISKIKSVCYSKSILKIIQIETDVSRGLFYFSIIGNINKSISESKSRILSCLRNSQFDVPNKKSQKVIISITPNNFSKDSGELDLAIAISYLSASKQIHIDNLESICCIGNVSITGEVYTEHQSLKYILFYAWTQGVRKFIIPRCDNMADFGMEGASICMISHISELKGDIDFQIKNTATDIYTSIIDAIDEKNQHQDSEPKIAQLRGLSIQKRALQIALAGNHHILFTGLPGTGKTALLQCIPELLDTVSLIETSDHISTHTNTKRPYIELPQNTSATTILGNRTVVGTHILAQNGVLVLNELCEFNKKAIESLRYCMDTSVSEKSEQLRSHILICASSNNCPCGTKYQTQHSSQRAAGQSQHPSQTTVGQAHLQQTHIQPKDAQQSPLPCTCSPYTIQQYQSKISEPVRDRFSIICNFSYQESDGHYINSTQHEEQSSIPPTYIPKIHHTRYISRKRNHGLYNQQLTLSMIQSFGMTDGARSLLNTVQHTFSLSHRRIINTYRVARTIADLDESIEIDTHHIIEAVGYTKTNPFS